jgi:beta-glucanase (GH16 family)
MRSTEGARRRAAEALALAVAVCLLAVAVVAAPAGAGAGDDAGPGAAAAPTELRVATGGGWLAWLWCLLGFCGPTPTTTTTTTSPSSTSSSSSSTTTTTTLPPIDEECLDKPKEGGGTWSCTFADEFSGTELDRSKWTPQVTGGSNFDTGPECFVDDPDNIALDGGALHLTVRQEAALLTCGDGIPRAYTSGMVSTNPAGGSGFAQTYGRYEIRARVTGAKVPGLHEAIWMYPVEPKWVWPWSGEIDIAEIYHRYPDRAIPYVHYSNALDPNVTNNECLIDDIGKFHTYLLEWTPERIRISYDGEVCIDDPWSPLYPQTGRQPFDEPFFLILTQALGVGGNLFNPATTPLPASTVVDYVRVWA